jgi:hypothetical protein
MKHALAPALLAFSLLNLLGCALKAQSNPPKVLAEFRGESLKWIHVAEPELRRKNFDLDKYIISVVEEDDS